MNVPEYKAFPLGAILPIPKQGPMFDNHPEIPQLWIWGSLTSPAIEQSSLERVSELIEAGWTQTTESLSILETQLCEPVRLSTDGTQESMQLWVKFEQGDKPPVPVILAFSIENNPEPQIIPMLNPLPLPQMGEYAFVEYANDLVLYGIQALPLEARQRWVSLGEALRKLSEPLLWPEFTQRHEMASHELVYRRQEAALVTQYKMAITEQTKAEYMLKIAHLQSAHIHIEHLRKALSKPTWLQEWREVQHMARELAQDYYNHHMQRVNQAAPASQIDQVETTQLQLLDAPEAPKKKRGRRPHQPATDIVAKNKDTISAISATTNREIINSLRDKDLYQFYKEQGVAESKRRFNKDKGQIIITIRPLDDENFETIIYAVNTLGDGCIDTFIALQAIAIERNGVEHIRTPVELSPDDILEVCGKKKSNGSYTPNQRAEVIAHLKTLSQAHVVILMPGRPARGKREGTVLKVEGALIDLLSWKIGEYKTITGEEVWERRSISVGKWVTMIPEISSKTAIMLRKLLAYSAKNERYQKRLGLYLTFMFRINARKGGAFEVSMDKLLEGAGIVPDKKNPGRFRDAIEHALACLQRDDAIGPYARVIDASEEGQEREKAVTEQAYGWWDIYSRQQWKFEAPARTKEQYKQLKKG